MNMSEKNIDQELDEIRKNTQAALVIEEEEKKDYVPKPSIRRLVVRAINPEIQALANDEYMVEQAMNYFPEKDKYSWTELQHIFSTGVQLTIRR